MTNSKELFNDLVKRVILDEDKSEIQGIIYLLLEKELGLTRTEILSGKEIALTDPAVFDSYLDQLNDHKPIQYILGETEFYGRLFNVNASVLIPRPETELLIEAILHNHKNHQSERYNVLDIGTGSGCIAITLALEMERAHVYATDISKRALDTARKNAELLGATIEFKEHNILEEEISFGSFHVIVSNPPYISEEEKMKMRRNVLDHEPHLALFAPGHDPLAFYKAIALKSKIALLRGGSVWVEINEHFGKEVIRIFEEYGYDAVRIIKDLDRKDRIVTARLN